MEVLDAIEEFESSPELRQKLYEYGKLKVLSPGDSVINEQAYIKSVPIVTKGSIRVLRSDEDGRELLLYYVRAGESCVMSFLGGVLNDTCKVKVVAEEETEILFIPIDKIKLLNKEYPEWLAFVFRLYHARFEELLNVVNAVAFKKMDVRLLDLLQTKKKLTNNNTLSISHEQLSNELGTARVVVSRLLKQMEEEGMVQLGRNKITLM